MKNLPYASATSKKARYNISKMLLRFGCESVGIMDRRRCRLQAPRRCHADPRPHPVRHKHG
jgi:hypothetical protein